MASSLASLGKKFLLVDADPQCNLTSFFLPDEQDADEDDNEDVVEGDEHGPCADGDDSGNVPASKPPIFAYQLHDASAVFPLEVLQFATLSLRKAWCPRPV